MGVARKGSKSVTFYLDEALDEVLSDFATKTFRSKSNAAELLLRKSLQELGDFNEGIDLPARPAMIRRKAGELLDRAPKKPGPKPKAPPAVEDDIPEAPKKRRGRPPKAEKAVPAAPAAQPKRRGRKAASAAV